MPSQEWLRTAAPQLIADVELYATERGGRSGPARLGWTCLCTVSDRDDRTCYSASPLIGDEEFAPGERKRLGLVFLNDEGADIMRQAGEFHLYEGARKIGTATVVKES